MSITYQQAKRIRKTGFLDLMSDQLMYEKKIGTAISKTISLKARGRAMGLTQYFDPLNIARMMTFGSSIGPALLGHLTGRDPRDIQYFSKRYKPIHERKKTGDRLSKMGGSDMDVGSNIVLSKIYKLMSNSYAKDIDRRELEKNREEEHEMEDERRHKELLEALGNKKPTLIKLNQEKENGIFDSLSSFTKNFGLKFLEMFAMMKGLKLLFKNALVSGIGKVIKWMGKGIISILRLVKSSFFMLVKGIKKTFSLIKILAEALEVVFSNPLIRTALAAVSAADYFKHLQETFRNRWGNLTGKLDEAYLDLEYFRKKYGENSKEYKDQQDRISDLEIAKSDLQLEMNNKVQSFGEANQEAIGKVLKDFGTLGGLLDFDDFGNFDFGDDLISKLENELPSLNISDDLSKIEMNEGSWGNLFNKFNGSSGTSNTSETSDAPSNFNALVDSGRAASGQLQRATVSQPADVTTPDMPATQVESPSVENRTNRLNLKSTPVVPIIENNNNLTTSSDRLPIKRPMPSVRNQERGFMDIIYDNIVVV